VIQEVIDDFYGAFVDLVAEARSMKREKVLQLSDGGRIYSGKQAEKLGLVDAIGGMEHARAWLRKEKDIDASLEVRDMEVEKKYKNLIDKVADSTGISFLSSERLRLDGLLLIWQPERL
jgi:protease-4